MTAERRRRRFVYDVATVFGVLMILAGVAAVLVVVWPHHPDVAQQVPHIKVRIGTWYTRHAARWT